MRYAFACLVINIVGLGGYFVGKDLSQQELIPGVPYYNGYMGMFFIAFGFVLVDIVLAINLFF